MDTEQRTIDITKTQNELNSSREINLSEKNISKSKKKTKFKLVKNLIRKKLTKKKKNKYYLKLLSINLNIKNIYFLTKTYFQNSK